jgi:hypothetical protein
MMSYNPEPTDTPPADEPEESGAGYGNHGQADTNTESED